MMNLVNPTTIEENWLQPAAKCERFLVVETCKSSDFESLRRYQELQLTQDVPPALDRHVDEWVKDSQGHEGHDASDNDPEAEVDVDDVGLVEPHGCWRHPEFHSHL